jgi:serine/threonine protein kinase
MNSIRAKALAQDLLGKSVGGWHVQAYLNHGKSAILCLAEKDGLQAALKIMDPDIVERYGGPDAQRKRIERERSLIGKMHPNLIQIYDGGEDGDRFFVVMEYFEGRNLADALQEIPAAFVRTLLSQIASAAQFLEDSSYAHRDIKPANITVNPGMTSAKLLDLGVIRPFDLSSVTDEGDQRYFVGTLQYSPPELLFREEEHSVDGWRAITFYQLGGVLHDLLVRKPLFEEFKTPYARLVRAVEQEIPRLDAPQAEPDLRLLAQNCLAKAPRQRLDTVKWEDFSRPSVADPMDSARRRIAQHRAAVTHSESLSAPSEQNLLRQQQFVLRSSINSAVISTCTSESLPRYSITKNTESDRYLLRAVFEPSPTDDLRQYLVIYCRGTVLDAKANLAELAFWACTSLTSEAVPGHPDLNTPSHSVKGVLIEQDIRTHVQQYLLLAYAEALDHVTRPADSVSWLSIEADS